MKKSVSVAALVKQLNFEFFWNVVERWNFVVTCPFSQLLARRRKELFLESHQSDTLDESSFYLANVDCWVEWFSDIHEDFYFSNLKCKFHI